MSRTVITSGLETTTTKKDPYADKILKYVPGEAVGLYLTAIGLLSTAKDQIPFDIMTWVVFIGVLIVLPIYLWKAQEVEVWIQIAITMGAYVLWVFTIGGPFSQFSWYHPVYGALGVLFFTFIVPKIR
ncbi:MAG: hypothetical protein NWF10_05185 [Candidatus Bathyarchaeota archaeon]|nr:hypothetical protein [Candidatus Bathyarchaeota archaeon]